MEKDDSEIQSVSSQGTIVGGKYSKVTVQPIQFGDIDEDDEKKDDSKTDFDMILDVPLSVSVEIGHAKKAVKDILNIKKGTIIELNKQAGDPVDVIVNGQMIARGDVTVVNDNFGVRISEITSNRNFLQKKNGSKDNG